MGNLELLQQGLALLFQGVVVEQLVGRAFEEEGVVLSEEGEEAVEEGGLAVEGLVADE